MYKEDLALNNLQWLIYHKPNHPSLLAIQSASYIGTEVNLCWLANAGNAFQIFSIVSDFFSIIYVRFYIYL